MANVWDAFFVFYAVLTSFTLGYLCIRKGWANARKLMLLERFAYSGIIGILMACGATLFGLALKNAQYLFGTLPFISLCLFGMIKYGTGGMGDIRIDIPLSMFVKEKIKKEKEAVPEPVKRTFEKKTAEEEKEDYTRHLLEQQSYASKMREKVEEVKQKEETEKRKKIAGMVNKLQDHVGRMKEEEAKAQVVMREKTLDSVGKLADAIKQMKVDDKKRANETRKQEVIAVDVMSLLPETLENEEYAEIGAESKKSKCPFCGTRDADIVFCPDCGQGLCSNCSDKVIPYPSFIEYQCPMCGLGFKVKAKNKIKGPRMSELESIWTGVEV